MNHTELVKAWLEIRLIEFCIVLGFLLVFALGFALVCFITRKK